MGNDKPASAPPAGDAPFDFRQVRGILKDEPAPEPECQMLWHPRSNGNRFWKVFVCQKCGAEVEADSHPVRQCPAPEPVPVAQGLAVDAALTTYRVGWESYRGRLFGGLNTDDYLAHQRGLAAVIADHARIVAELQAARERAYDNRDMALQAAEHEKSRADALEASLAACRADAERYRWLCERHPLRLQRLTTGAVVDGTPYRKDLTDAAIDAARAVLPLAGESQ